MSPFALLLRLSYERTKGGLFIKKERGGGCVPEKKKKFPPDAERAMEEYGNSLYRLCSVMTGNREDAQDAVQDCFLRYITKAPDFNDSEHEKAWLIRVASNICHDILRIRKHSSFVSLDEIRNLGTSEDNAQILGLLIALDEKYRIIMHLHYVEGYKTDELSALLGISSSAVKKRLQRGREALREIYEKEAKQ
ncbi:MAG: RNA polymerase sigma factor [Clostridia bacterium]|nr:RNA polymerase sigma factor [Clostridia bacterium]